MHILVIFVDVHIFISETLEELSFEASSQLIHALITTTLDYCNGILFDLPKNKIERLQRIQNQAARMLERINNHSFIGYLKVKFC